MPDGCHLTDTPVGAAAGRASFAWSGELCGYLRLRPQPARPPPSSAGTPDPNWRAMVSLRRLLYFAAVPGPETLGSGVRIMLLSWGGAMGIRTPDLLHAIQRQHVHRSPSVQVTVSGRPHESSGIQAGCCTFVLYRPEPPPRAERAQFPGDAHWDIAPDCIGQPPKIAVTNGPNSSG
jgi:hypothetical protein